MKLTDPDYFHEKYGLAKNTSFFKEIHFQALRKSVKTSKSNACCCVYFICLNFKMECLAFKQQIQKLLSSWDCYADC